MHKAILFDLDNTLVDRDRAFAACLSAAFPEQKDRAELLALDASGYGCRQKLFTAWRARSPLPIDQASLGQRIADQLRPDPDLLEALRRLSASFKLAVISNGGAIQRRKLAAAGLTPCFGPDRVFLSCEVGVEKPDPRIFIMASEQLAVQPHECLFIGDHPSIDGAAKAAGMDFQIAPRVLRGQDLLAFLR